MTDEDLGLANVILTNGARLYVDHAHPEYSAPETTNPRDAVVWDKAGELVITTLTKEALPMIRYRTRDITRAVAQACECGRTHMRISKLSGRTDDMLIIRGVNVYPSQVEEVLLSFAHLAGQYQLVVSRDDSMDILVVRIEAQPDLAAEAYPVIAEKVQRRGESKGGGGCGGGGVTPGGMPPHQGKTLRVRGFRQATKPTG